VLEQHMVVIFGIDDQPFDAPFGSDLRRNPEIVRDDAPMFVVKPFQLSRVA
jgi:hypothetical protein